jgi:hypothetical protein
MKTDYPNGIAFIMMKFGSTKIHNEIVETIKQTLEPHNITALRADDRQYHDHLYHNIIIYVYLCKFGIAVFERVVFNEHNPNVALEVGYLLALGKKVCILKDDTVQTLTTDLLGHLYKTFNTQEVNRTLPPELTKWLQDQGFAPTTKALPKPAT